jgi:hypothetical protein
VGFAVQFSAAGDVLAIFNGFRLVKYATLVLALTVLLQGGASAQNVPHAVDPAPLLPEETHTKYVPITGKERLTWFVGSTVGVESLAFAGPFSAGWGTAFKSPPEYPANITGFAQRYGMRLTGVSTGNAMNVTLGAIWGEDPRYFRAPDEPFKKRVVNVLDLTFRAYYRDGERHFAYARLAGNAGSSFLSNTWRVPSETDWQSAVSRILFGIGGYAASNAFSEFLPDVFKLMRRNKQAHPPQAPAAAPAPPQSQLTTSDLPAASNP